LIGYGTFGFVKSGDIDLNLKWQHDKHVGLG